MSVIVKGMEMPGTCEECQVSCEVGSDLHCQVTDDGNKWGWKKSENGFESRPDWCPLRPLPEKHGRLIDADAFKETLEPADVRPVVRGRWEIQSCGMGSEDVFCSVCKCGSGRPYWPFCPMCGADMRGEQDE